MKHSAIVCEYGWIICGVIVDEKADAFRVTDASVVRKWSNGKGIGGIAYSESKDEYTLDYIGEVLIQKSKILFVIPCEW
ncbi:MAG: hypothetical protein IKG59_01875 [Firmicutes bacterium]|nr:hypothetical protein [Bacillota bacterium]